MTKKILFVDMDGVLCNFDKMIFDIKPELGMPLSHAPCPHGRYSLVEEVMINNPRLFKDLEAIDGGVEAVKRLWPHYNIYFLSTPCWNVPESFTDKRIWIGDKFGEDAKDRLILTQRKDLCIGDYLVDDRLVNGAAEFQGKHVHFGHGVFPTWVEVETYLMNEITKLKLVEQFNDTK